MAEIKKGARGGVGGHAGTPKPVKVASATDNLARSVARCASRIRTVSGPGSDSGEPVASPEAASRSVMRSSSNPGQR